MATVEARGLSKSYVVHPREPGLLGALRGLLPSTGRVVEAVAALDLVVEPGEFVGFVGPNGAGKSTTLKMLTGILAPTGGDLRVCGVVPHRDRVGLASRIGVVFGQRTQLWWDLSPGEGFELLGRIYRVPPADLRARRAELVERLDLGALLDVPVRKLSLGQKMRCELCAAMLHAPELLLLDEPTIGLDVVVKDALHGFLRELAADRGTTVLLTSHDLDDIERLCRRVVVIDGGRLLHDGDLASLRTRYGHRRRVELHLREVPRATLPLPDAATLVEQVDRRVVIELDAARLTVPDLLRRLLAEHDVLDVSVQEARIEDTLRRMVGG